MEEGERAHTEGGTTSTCTSPPTSPTSNGKPGGRGEKVTSPTERGRAGGADGFAGFAAKMLGAKVKGQGGQKPGKSGGRNHKQNGCDDDLPLGSEAHSLGPNHATDYSSKYAPTEDERSAWSRTISPGIMGWQSFSSDVSNHTSASSASLEQLLNDRQMDPEEMLLNLGFGAEPRSLMPTLARVPDRFLNHPSRAYGIEPPGLSDEQEDMASDNTDTTMPVPDKVLVPAATAAVTAHPKRRTGGFSVQGLHLQSGYGYVDVVSLLNKDVPLYFFNDQGSSCYYTLMINDRVEENEHDRSVVEEDRLIDFKEESSMWGSEHRSQSPHMDGMSDYCSQAREEAANRNPANMFSQTRTRRAEDTMRSQCTVHTKECFSQLRESLSPEEDMSEGSLACLHQTHCLHDTQGELSPEASEMLSYLRRKKEIGKLLSAQFLKLATQKIDSSLHETANRRLGTDGTCAQDSEAPRHQGSEDMTKSRSHSSPIKMFCQNLSSTCCSLASKLGISLSSSRDDVQSENQHDRSGTSVEISLPSFRDIAHTENQHDGAGVGISLPSFRDVTHTENQHNGAGMGITRPVLKSDAQLGHCHDRPGAGLATEYSQSTRFNSLQLLHNTQGDRVTVCGQTQNDRVTVCGQTQGDRVTVVCGQTQRDRVTVCGQTQRDIVTSYGHTGRGNVVCGQTQRDIVTSCGHTGRDNVICGQTQRDIVTSCGHTGRDNVVCGRTQRDIVTSCGHTGWDNVVCGRTQRDIVHGGIVVDEQTTDYDLVHDSRDLDDMSDDSGDYYEDFYDDFNDDCENYVDANTEENIDETDNLNVGTKRDLSVWPVSVDEDSEEKDLGHAELEWCHDGEHLIFDETCVSLTHTLPHTVPHSSSIFDDTCVSLTHTLPHSSSTCYLQSHNSSMNHTQPHHTSTFHTYIHSSPVDYTHPRSLSTYHTHPHSPLRHQMHPYSSSVDHTKPHSFSMYHTYPNYSSVDYTHPHKPSFDQTFPPSSFVDHTFPHNSTFHHTHPRNSSVDYAFPFYSSVNHKFPHTPAIDQTSPHSSSVDHTHPHMFSVDHTHPHSSSVDHMQPDR